MFRLGQFVNGEWVAHFHPPVYEVGSRLIAGVPRGDPGVLMELIECLEPPYFLLYVLHTSRGEGPLGRYQSPLVPTQQVREFLAHFGPFLSGDARDDLWAHSPADDATVVWDRHNVLYAYGPLEAYESALVSIGFVPGSVEILYPHQHYYRAEFDS